MSIPSLWIYEPLSTRRPMSEAGQPHGLASCETYPNLSTEGYMKLRPKTVWQLGPAMEPSARDAEPLPLRARGLENENGANHCNQTLCQIELYQVSSYALPVLQAFLTTSYNNCSTTPNKMRVLTALVGFASLHLPPTRNLQGFLSAILWVVMPE